MKSKELQQHFSSKEKKFFEDIKVYLKKSDKVLKIGNGFGYLSEFIRDYVSEIKILEIHIFEKTINKTNVILYDGLNIPAREKEYDVAVFNLVLHHIPNNIEYLKQVTAKTKRSIVLYEQTYDNLFQKIQLVWRDWYINRQAGTPCRIYWNSYFKRSELEGQLRHAGLRVVQRYTKRSHTYYKELLILGIDKNE